MIGCNIISSVNILKGEISGKVIDESTGLPVEGATVEITPTVTRDVYTDSTKTDADGQFSFKNINKGPYTIKVKKDGYSEKSAEVNLQPEDYSCSPPKLTVEIKILKNVEATADTNGAIKGKATDSNGNALQDVNVTTSPGTSEKKTDNNGDYEITDVKPGNYTISATKDGYSTATKEVTVKSGEVVDGNISMTKSNGDIRGKATDPAGNAVTGVVIATAPATAQSVTDAQGNYAILEVIPGDYTIYAGKTGYDTATKAVTVKANETADGNITIQLKQWAQLSPSGSPPTARRGHSSVWDEQNNRMLVFGGSIAGGIFKNDLWSYNGTAWTQLSPAGDSPVARVYHTAVWDKVNNRMLVFGGFDGGGYRNDLWEFNGTSWVKLSTADTPSIRYAHSAVWDPKNNRMLVFAGAAALAKNDLWSFNGINWVQLSPGGSPPSERFYQSAVWDKQNDRMLVFGGSLSGSNVNDLWSFDGANWMQLSPGGVLPSARNSHNAVWDNQYNRMLVFGGTFSGTKLNDLWSFDGTNWTQLTPVGTPPSERYVFSVSWDPQNNRMLVFGGYNGSSHFNDLWSY